MMQQGSRRLFISTPLIPPFPARYTAFAPCAAGFLASARSLQPLTLAV